MLGALMLNRLDLTDAQRGQVKGILDSHRDEQSGLQQRAMAARQALEAAIQASPLDEAAIRGKAAEVAAVDADLAVARGRILNEVTQVLTSDQQAKLKELQAQQKQRMEQRRGRRR
jgi:Spy/CpxP family protein refolding chaperone